jgi:hypothetical protein
VKWTKLGYSYQKKEIEKILIMVMATGISWTRMAILIMKEAFLRT